MFSLPGSQATVGGCQTIPAAWQEARSTQGQSVGHSEDSASHAVKNSRLSLECHMPVRQRSKIEKYIPTIGTGYWVISYFLPLRLCWDAGVFFIPLLQCCVASRLQICSVILCIGTQRLYRLYREILTCTVPFVEKDLKIEVEISAIDPRIAIFEILFGNSPMFCV